MQDEKKDLAIKAALMYYEGNMLQSDIAKELYISRSYVSQLLKYAKETGIVRIEINIDEGSMRCYQKENTLREFFPHLDNCYIMKSDSEEFSNKSIGRFAAPILANHINNASVIGVTQGTSVVHAIHQIKEWMLLQDRNHVAVQMMGSFNSETSLYARPNEVVESLSRILKCPAFYLNCPALINDGDIRKRLLCESSIRDIINLWKKMDLIIFGVGFTEQGSRLFSFYDDTLRKVITNSSACGEINSHYFDIYGNYMPMFEDRTICASNDIIKLVKSRVAICIGAQKNKALLGALRGGYINTLITDSLTADAMKKLLLMP